MTNVHPVVSILSAGRDASLLSSRNQVLKARGYSVVTAVTPSEIVDRFFEGDFDLLILCHSIPPDERRKLVRMVRNYSPGTPVVVLSSHEGQPSDDGAIRVTTDPQEIVDTVADVTRRSARE